MICNLYYFYLFSFCHRLDFPINPSMESAPLKFVNKNIASLSSVAVTVVAEPQNVLYRKALDTRFSSFIFFPPFTSFSTQENCHFPGRVHYEVFYTPKPLLIDSSTSSIRLLRRTMVYISIQRISICIVLQVHVLSCTPVAIFTSFTFLTVPGNSHLWVAKTQKKPMRIRLNRMFLVFFTHILSPKKVVYVIRRTRLTL